MTQVTSSASARPRRWPIYLPFGLLVGLAVIWSGAWFYLAGRAPATIADWRSHEAAAGRSYDCGHESVRGFPFRIEVECADLSATFARTAPPFAVDAANLHFAWQVYQPTLVIAELAGPLTLGEPRAAPTLRADWRLGQASVRATTTGVGRVSIVFDDPALRRVGASGGDSLFRADHVELHGRPSSSASGDEAVDLAVRLVQAVAPALHPIAAKPIDADATGVLHGFVDPASRPLPVVLRDWQSRGGSLEVNEARVQQDDVIAVGSGTLGLTARGGINGQLRITVVGLEKVLQALGADRLLSRGDVGSAIDALDRMLPGLGNMARQNAGATIVAGLGAFGQSTQLEGKPAMSVLLRFDDGAVQLGPLMLGRIAPLF
jgi:hypothetical protein